jgi:predicted flavoprotein YhiN
MVRRLGHSVDGHLSGAGAAVLSAGFHAELSGVSQPAELSTFAGGKRVDRRVGSLLWTHFGISGPGGSRRQPPLDARPRPRRRSR